MVRKFKFAALTGALMMVASPAFAQDIVQDMMKDLGGLDPTGTLAPQPAPAAAPAAKPMMKKKHHGKMMHHKKMMKKKM